MLNISGEILRPSLSVVVDSAMNVFLDLQHSKNSFTMITSVAQLILMSQIDYVVKQNLIFMLIHRLYRKTKFNIYVDS